MNQIALVEAAKVLPPPSGALALSALQLRCWEGFDFGCSAVHAYALDNALASTLEPGRWVSFKAAGDNPKLIKELEEVHPESVPSNLQAVVRPADAHERIGRLQNLLHPLMGANTTGEKSRAEALEVHHKLQDMQTAFGVQLLPAELLQKCFRPAHARQLFPR